MGLNYFYDARSKMVAKILAHNNGAQSYDFGVIKKRE